MSYIPTEWKSGDIVTSAKLNKIELGIKAFEPPILYANITYESDSSAITLVNSLSYNDIAGYVSNGIFPIILATDGEYTNIYHLDSFGGYDNYYWVDFYNNYEGKLELLSSSATELLEFENETHEFEPNNTTSK